MKSPTEAEPWGDYKELLDWLDKWFQDRKEAYNTNYGWTGRNLLDNTQAAAAIADLEQDLNVVLKAVRQLIIMQLSSEHKTSQKASSKNLTTGGN